MVEHAVKRMHDLFRHVYQCVGGCMPGVSERYQSKIQASLRGPPRDEVCCAVSEGLGTILGIRIQWPVSQLGEGCFWGLTAVGTGYSSSALQSLTIHCLSETGTPTVSADDHIRLFQPPNHGAVRPSLHLTRSHLAPTFDHHRHSSPTTQGELGPRTPLVTTELPTGSAGHS